MSSRPVRDFVTPDERDLERMRELAPGHPDRRIRWRLCTAVPWNRLSDWLCPDGRPCGYCGRKAVLRRVVVNPIRLQRTYIDLCKRRRCDQRLRLWEGQSAARRRRAQYDWERQHPEAAPVALIGHIPPQYPSVSRATLRAFLDSGRDMATLAAGGASTVSALNGSIRRLGFAEQVFAEIRSGQAVLRRSPEKAS